MLSAVILHSLGITAEILAGMLFVGCVVTGFALRAYIRFARHQGLRS